MPKRRGNAKRKTNATEIWSETMDKMTTDEQYQYMLDHDILTDCTFVVGPEDGETREFKAHRVHIARLSVVFEAMLLRGDMSEAKTGHVRIVDISPDTFQLLLSSIYGQEPKTSTFQEAQALAYAAHKYQLKKLLEICVIRMSALITHANIWSALETADLLQQARLKETCLQILQRDTLKCITDAGFLQTSEQNVALLLEQDELNIDDELVLVNMVAVHWARHAARQRGLSEDDSGIRAVLKPRLLSLFRFLAMSPQQFMLGPGVAGWLTSDEKYIISECLRSRDFGKWPKNLSSVVPKRKILTVTANAVQIQVKESPGKFICKRQIIASQPGVQQTINNCCLIYNNHCWTDSLYHCVHARLIFKVNSNCKWLGFQYASRHREDPTTFLTKNPIYNEEYLVRRYTFNHSLSTDFQKIRIGKDKEYKEVVEYNSTVTVMFDDPMTLVNYNWFEVEAIFRQNYHDKRSSAAEYPNPLRAQKVCTAEGVEFVFHTEKQARCHVSRNDGVIESLIFSI